MMTHLHRHLGIRMSESSVATNETTAFIIMDKSNWMIKVLGYTNGCAVTSKAQNRLIFIPNIMNLYDAMCLAK